MRLHSKVMRSFTKEFLQEKNFAHDQKVQRPLAKHLGQHCGVFLDYIWLDAMEAKRQLSEQKTTIQEINRAKALLTSTNTELDTQLTSSRERIRSLENQLQILAAEPEASRAAGKTSRRTLPEPDCSTINDTRRIFTHRDGRTGGNDNPEPNGNRSAGNRHNPKPH